jgi:RimJ/RimL family protein N-acetyltransferase
MPKVDTPILLDIPDAFETERCIVRIPRAGDGAPITAVTRESQPEIAQWLGWAVDEPDEEKNEALMRRSYAHYILREDFRFTIIHKASGDYIGMTGLHYVNWIIPRCEIGYWMRTSYTGQGIMTEVVTGLTDFAFTHCLMERVNIRMDTENGASVAVAQKCGYVQEGILRAEMRLHIDDSIRDTFSFVMTRPMWLERIADQSL